MRVIRRVFLFAHPDDEFACSQIIFDAVSSGAEVHCIFLTDGGGRGQSPCVRMNESIRALATLGVQKNRIHFIGVENGFPDSKLHTVMEDASQALQSWIEHNGRVDSIFLPAWEGGHQDHDALHVVGVLVASRNGVECVKQFPLYNGFATGGVFFRILYPLPINGDVFACSLSFEQRFRAIRLCFFYPSQWRSWLGLLPFFILHMMLKGCFPIQNVNCGFFEKFMSRPHPGKLLYERRGGVDFAEFREEVKNFLASNGCRLA